MLFHIEDNQTVTQDLDNNTDQNKVEDTPLSTETPNGSDTLLEDVDYTETKSDEENKDQSEKSQNESIEDEDYQYLEHYCNDFEEEESSEQDEKSIIVYENELERKSIINDEITYETKGILEQHHSGLYSDQEGLNDFLNDAFKIVSSLNSMKKENKIIGITSAVPGEGSSTMASVLATLSSGMQSGTGGHGPQGETTDVNDEHYEKTDSGILLIDSQTHNPSLHQKFGVKPAPGLTDLIHNMLPFQFVVNKVSPSLKLMTVGQLNNISFTSSEIEKFSFLLDYARFQFETVFIDIPAILEYPEGLVLSQMCDAVILVVQAGKTKWKVVEEAKNRLERSQVKILGGVLNRRNFFIPDWLYKKI